MDVKAIQEIRTNFPIFSGALQDWAYLDNAATTQKPNSVIQAVSGFYQHQNANIHRGLYELSSSATQCYEATRKKVKSFLGASHESEIAFTGGTTESINIVANSFRQQMKEGDEIIISAMEHHANLIPWQQACLQTKATLKIIPVTPRVDLVLNQLPELLTSKTKLLAVSHISNAMGTVNPIEDIINVAHQYNVPVLLDVAQSAGHQYVSVSKLDVDFLVLSGHKMYGPMGTGVLYVKRKYHEFIYPLMFGGGSIREVQFNVTRFRDFPYSVEAGTPNVPGVLGLGTAIDFLRNIDLHDILKHEQKLSCLLRNGLKSLPFVSVVGEPKHYAGIVSFVVDGIHAHDVAGFLADKKIAVRAGHHCVQPLHDELGLNATVRVSFAMYNTPEEVERVLDALVELKKIWS